MMAIFALPILRREGHSDFGATYIYFSNPTNEDAALLFNSERQLVKRVLTEPRYTPQYEALRSRFSEFVSAPTFAVEDAGYSIVEEWVRGKPMQHLDVGDQVSHARTLLNSLARMTREHGSSDARQFMKEALEKLERVEDLSIHKFVDHKLLMSAATSWPLVPSHGDLFSHNVLVDECEPRVIDWNARLLALRPFFIDAFRMLLVVPRSFSANQLVPAFFRGAFDGQLQQLFHAAGSEIEICKNRWQIAALYSISESHMYSALFPKSASFPEALSQRWNRLCAVGGLPTEH